MKTLLFAGLLALSTLGAKADDLVFENNGNQIGYVVRDVRVLPFWG